MDISKMTSVPLDGDRGSFLTLPAEIRNIVYELLFERDGPVLVHNIAAYYAQKPLPPEDDIIETDGYQDGREEDTTVVDDEGEGDDSSFDWNTGEPIARPNDKVPTKYELYEQELLEWDATLENEEEELKTFDHGFYNGLGLLKSCRQIYHEAASVLYGQNTFLVTRVSSRHDGSKDYHGDYAYHQLRYTPVWLCALGTQFRMLKKVEIDLTAVCSDDCGYDMLLPLLRVVWAHPRARCRIAFAHTCRYLDRAIHEDYEDDFEEQFSSAQIDMLNRALTSLGRHDALNLKCYSASDYLLPCVSLDISEGQVTGNFRFFKNRKPWLCREFESAGDGSIMWKSSPPIRSWIDLPHHIRCQIISYATSSIRGIVVELDSRTTRGLDYNMFQATSNSSIWDDAIRAISTRVPLTLELISTMPTTGFAAFKLLKDIWTSNPGSQIALTNFQYRIAERIMPRSLSHGGGECRIVLQLVLDTAAVEPCIKLNDLIDILCSPRHEINNNTKLVIALFSRDDAEPNAVTASMTFAELRRILFFLFTDLLYQVSAVSWPWMPEIWISSLGNIVSPDADTPSAGANSWDCVVYDQEFIVVADRIKDRFSSRYKRHRCWSHKPEGCMYCAWDVLRNCMERQWGSWVVAEGEHKRRSVDQGSEKV